MARSVSKEENIRRLRVFVASPGDVRAEREKLPSVVERLNRGIGRSHGVSIDLWRWETDARPELGEPQALINPELDQADIVVVILWKRLGTPTLRASSGTEEEVLRSIERWNRTGKPRVQIYVCNRPIPRQDLRSEEAREQFDSLMRFLDSLSKIALSVEFAATEEFETKAFDNLQADVLKLLESARDSSSDALEPRPQSALIDEDRYLKHVEETCGFVNLTGLLGDKAAPPVRIEDVYVSLSTTRPDGGSHSQPRGKETAEKSDAPTREDAVRHLITALNERKRDADWTSMHAPMTAALLELRVPPDEATDPRTLESLTRRLDALPRPFQTEAVREVCQTIDVEDALRRARHLLIEGDPGSGKTTILLHVAVALARSRAGTVAAAERMGFARPFPIPIFVPMRRLGAWLLEPEQKKRTAKDGSLLSDFLETTEGPHGFNRAWLDAALEAGQLVVLLDGLDEIQDTPIRERVAAIVLDFVHLHSRCRFALTSRPAGLTGTMLKKLGELGGLAHCRVRPLDDAQMKSFVTAWFRALVSDRKEADRRAGDLMSRLETREEIVKLARTPVMLTAIAVVHLTVGEIPERRVELYERLVKALAHRLDFERDELGRVLCGPVSIDGKTDLLEEIAWRVHTSGADARRIERTKLLEVASTELSRDLGRELRPSESEGLVEALSERSGLLIPDGPHGFRFRHHTFQEFLVARRICRRSEDAGKELGTKLHEAWWREVIQLAVGYKAMGSPVDGRRLLHALAETAAASVMRPNHGESVAALANVARAALDLRTFRVPELEVEARLLDTRVSELLDDPAQPGALADRVVLGEFLGSFGTDPRLTEERRWIRIEPGPFSMGGADEAAFGDEQPVHQVHVPAFELQRWVTTVGEYARFVDGGGYAERKLWSAEGWTWKEAEGIVAPEVWDEQRASSTNIPIVGISWFEADAYCRWLTYQQPDPRRSLVVRLPSEAEWEKAARSKASTRSDARPKKIERIYPWGDTWDPRRANTREGELARVVPVGLFPAGCGPYGHLDLAGNVEEWCADNYRSSYDAAPTNGRAWVDKALEDRVVRGGSFIFGAVNARSAYRSGGRPLDRWHSVGFRPARSVTAE